MMDRNTAFNDGKLFPVPCEAGAKIDAGHLVCVNSAGYAIAGAKASGNLLIGVCDEAVDNTGGAQGARSVMVRRGLAVFLENNSGSAVTQAEVGKSCYLHDSVTVSKTDGGNAPVVGRVLTVSADSGVQVLIG
ncbi:DUF2190 family protein [Edwardsiella tarda]|nr:capsid cement protein [Edwardsiella hoshinae]